MRNPLTFLAGFVVLLAAFNPVVCNVRPSVAEIAEPVCAPAEPVVATCPDEPVILPEEPTAVVAVVEKVAPVQVEPKAIRPTDRRVNLVVVQDITASYKDNIQHLRIAALELLDAAASWPAGSRIGMSTFVGGVAEQPWTSLTPVDDLEPVQEQWQTLDTCNCKYLHALYRDAWCEMYYGSFDTSPQMQDCFAHGTQSNPAAGLQQAIDMLQGHAGRSVILFVGDAATCCGTEKTEDRKNALISSAEKADDLGYELWSIVTDRNKPDYLDVLAQNGGRVVHTEPESVPQAMATMIEALAIPLSTPDRGWRPETRNAPFSHRKHRR